MAFRRITIQDLADACGLSRNTVSKVFNGRGTVKEETRQRILIKAQELGFYQLPDDKPAPAEDRRQNIVLLTSHMPANDHFGTLFIPVFAAQLSRDGYTLRMIELSEEELKKDNWSSRINLDQTAGIVVIEIFDKAAIENICALGLPSIFVDDYFGAVTSQLDRDRISMENLAGMTALVDHVIAKGARKIGFVGDPKHCSSFAERWFAFHSAVTAAGLSVDEELCILDPDDSPYNDPVWLTKKIRQFPLLPDALICINDYIAIRVMSALKHLGVSVPGQVMVTGYDGTAQSAVVEPGLTTVQIHGDEIGRVAADMLLNRLSHPDRPYISVYVRTTPVWRESTDR